MLTIHGDRGSGKTTALVAAFKQDPAGVLVLPNRAMQDYAFRKWPELRNLKTAVPQNVDCVILGLSPEARLYVDEIRMVELSPYARSRVVASCGS